MPAFDENEINGGKQPDGQHQGNEFFEIDQEKKGRKKNQQDRRDGGGFFYQFFQQDQKLKYNSNSFGCGMQEISSISALLIFSHCRISASSKTLLYNK